MVAQQQLESLREKRRAERIAAGLPVRTDEHGRFLFPEIRNPYPVIGELPAHLGWDSGAVTAVLRSKGPGMQEGRGESMFAHPSTRPLATSPTRNLATSPTYKLYPDVALGMLRKELAAAGRIWLLLGYIDNVGRGWLTFETAREKLTGKKSDLQVCGWRQLRNLLNEGEGVFWMRENGRIWLRSVAKVAAALGVRRLHLQPVALPINVLLNGIGQVRAHFYASFHSSRGKQDAKAAPIARDTLARISHVPQRTQRFYEQRAKVKTRRNFAIGQMASDIESEKIGWKQGMASFQLKDQDGWHGRKGRIYLAWQLPNNYSGPHAKQPRGRMKRINQELADLFMKGMTGNGENQVEGRLSLRQAQGPIPEPIEGALPRRFFGNGRLAAKALNRSANQIYWKRADGLQQAQSPGYQLWYVMSQGKF
ncbi:MAG: hypothetical protein H6667_11280 [Ardenticatenaceae bacterium]|nr:hypothetical protein [Ardenticatenaceae bacterium]